MEDRDKAGDQKDFAIAKSSASTQDWPRGNDFYLDDEELNDTTTTLHGAKAITGKAVYSANQTGRNSDQPSAQQTNEKREAREAQELMARAWDAQKIMLGGIEMTNKEAQEARQRVIDHDDEYARKAVREGRISENQIDEFKRWIRRDKELEDKKRNGTITKQEEQESANGKRSQVGQAANAAYVQDFQHEKEKGISFRADAAADQSRTSVANSISGRTFASAPEASADFKTAASATPAAVDTTPPAVSPVVRKQEFDLRNI